MKDSKMENNLDKIYNLQMQENMASTRGKTVSEKCGNTLI